MSGVGISCKMLMLLYLICQSLSVC